MIHDLAGKLLWLVDQSAAGQLSQKESEVSD